MNNMNWPLISVIVPVYNSERFIRRCIYSILMQTYINFELIIINDGSTDNSLRICREYQKKDNRIKIYNQKNMGLSCARNAGIKMAEGTYISFVDSDDYIHPKFLEYLYIALISSNSDISMCYHIKSFFSSDLLCKKKYKELKSETISGMDAVMKYADEDAFYYVCPCNKLYKKELFENLKFPEGKISEDCYLLFNILLLSKSISITYQKLYFYYQNRKSIMHTNMYIADYNIDAYKNYYSMCKNNFSKTKCDNLKLPILYKIIDFLVEDYWKATIYRNYKRKKEVKHKYLEIKNQIIKYGGVLKFKYKLYEFNKYLYVFARTLFEIFYVINTDLENFLYLIK